jgi:hypothetical protein
MRILHVTPYFDQTLTGRGIPRAAATSSSTKGVDLAATYSAVLNCQSAGIEAAS